MADNTPAKNPNGADEPIYGMVHGARLFEEPDDPSQDEDWGPVVNHDWGTAREQKPAKEGAEADADGKPAQDPLVSELKGQVSALQRQLEQMQMASVYQSPQQAPQGQQQDPGPQLEELPDPYEDPKAYADVVARNTRAQIMHEQKQGQQQQQSRQAAEQKYGELWQDFQMKHKDYAENFDQVQFAANKVAQKAVKRGWDIERYMFVHRDQFMEDIVSEMKNIFGPKGQEAQMPAQPDHGTPIQNQQGQPQEPAHRTNGMFGGMNTGGRPSLGGSEEEASDPFTDIREFQKATGFYR